MQRWHPGQTATVTGAGTCGPADEYGYCREQYHAPDCGSLTDPVLAEVLAETGMYSGITTAPWRDEHGRTWARPAA
jgi:hypothetical protein